VSDSREVPAEDGVSTAWDRAKLGAMTARTCLLLFLAASCISAPSEQPRPPAIQASPLDAALVEGLAARRALHTPGRFHRRLDAFVGDWDVRVEDVDGRAIGSGVAGIAWTHGGLWQRWDLALRVAGGEHSVTGYFGYDVEREDFHAAWVSELASGLGLASGRGDPEGRGLVLRASRGGTEDRMQVLSDDSFVTETLTPDGSLLRRTHYTRQAVSTN